jgi:transcriptional regulator with XRE-family HTH domain
MHSGVTQAEVAHRTGVPRTTISAYERRARQPTLKVLQELLAGCGMRLWFNAIPEVGLEDEPTRQLLDLPPLRRLDDGQEDALIWLAEKLADAPDLCAIVGGKAAARLHGAVIRVPEIEILAEDRCSLDQVRELLLTADAAPFAGGFLVRIPDHFEGIQERAESISLFAHLSINIASPGDCTVSWHPRDLDHLALQRARSARFVSSPGETPV